ncbi:hypothetical protein OZ13_02830 [Xanthomonas cannabis pv. cannabis]|nr:hypothetical protein OZ13_02830 [Xanthomonas cannabis pv. cannabis]
MFERNRRAMPAGRSANATPHSLDQAQCRKSAQASTRARQTEAFSPIPVPQSTAHSDVVASHCTAHDRRVDHRRLPPRNSPARHPRPRRGTAHA